MTLTAHGPFDRNRRYIAAISGGPDSMVLLDWLNEQDIDIIAAHVNYHKRKTASRDEAVVKDWCKAHGIPFEKLDAFAPENAGNFQAWAREARYGFFRDLVQKYQADGVILAHHQDDMLETWLMAKERGSLKESWMMKEKSDLNGLKLYRPFLDLSKKELEDICQTKQIPYGIDESNLSDAYTRNRIRHRLEKMTFEQKAKLIEEMEADQKELEALRSAYKADHDENGGLIAGDKCRNLLWLSWFVKEKTGKQISKGQAKDLMEKLDRHGAIFFDGFWIEQKQDRIFIRPEDSLKAIVIEGESELENLAFQTGNGRRFQIGQSGKVIERFALRPNDFPLTIRPAQKGDVIEMRFGHLSLKTFLAGRKIEHSQRSAWPVIENRNKELIFVCGLGCSVGAWDPEEGYYLTELKTE